MNKIIKIGGASGYWGESMMATPQLLNAGGLDYIVYDYLAEITMSILARARASRPEGGFATDFISGVLKPHLPEIARQKVKILSNAGGVNPIACGNAARSLIAELGLDLKVAVITGDDLMPRKEDLVGKTREMFSSAEFPDPETLASVNAYLGAFPVAAALDAGADIVITGRSVDSAVTLGACIHAFGWGVEDWDQLAGGSLAGHIIECGPQATGGNFTDWELAGDISEIGYPIVEVSENGDFVCTKPEDTAGLVSRGTICEQMLYEIGDPQAYFLPDVVCDFSTSKIEEIGENRVAVTGTTGYPASETYKVSATYFEGFRGGTTMSFIGRDSDLKAQKYGENILKRARNEFRARNMADFSEVSLEVIGADSQYGAEVGDRSGARPGPREVVLKIAVKHDDDKAIGLMLKEASGLGLATPPGLSSFAGGRPKASPVVRLYSFLIDKDEIDVQVELDGDPVTYKRQTPKAKFSQDTIHRPDVPPEIEPQDMVDVVLEDLAWGRSGDKGNKSNIGIIARDPAYLPYIWASLSEAAVADWFKHFIEPGTSVDKYYLPASHSINFVLHEALGGGGIASLRNDPQGKAFAQVLLAHKVAVPSQIAEAL
jgi:hypothetical protein